MERWIYCRLSICKPGNSRLWDQWVPSCSQTKGFLWDKQGSYLAFSADWLSSGLLSYLDQGSWVGNKEVERECEQPWYLGIGWYSLLCWPSLFCPWHTWLHFSLVLHLRVLRVWNHVLHWWLDFKISFYWALKVFKE